MCHVQLVITCLAEMALLSGTARERGEFGFGDVITQDEFVQCYAALVTKPPKRVAILDLSLRQHYVFLKKWAMILVYTTLII